MISDLKYIDNFILLFIAHTMHSPFLDKLMVFFTTLGNSSQLWLTLAIVLLLTRKDRRWGILLCLALFLEALLCDGILKPLIARERPFTELTGYKPLINPPISYSFPSGHTMSSFTAATILYYRQKSSGIFFYTVAALIGFSRIYLFVHYPSDVLGGIVLGILLAYLLVKISKYQSLLPKA